MFVVSSDNCIREIPLDADSFEIVKDFIEWKETHTVNTIDNTLFIETGKSVFNQAINSTLRKLLKTLSIPQISMHKLRHSHATYLLANGIPIEVVSKRLGHVNTTMVRNVYGHLLESIEDESNEKILAII